MDAGETKLWILTNAEGLSTTVRFDGDDPETAMELEWNFTGFDAVTAVLADKVADDSTIQWWDGP